ncbi:cell surface glycoprotein [Streptomyces sp. BH034]|uniref:zinc finger domain-containing protein n=1 Tax=Streptomyces sp. BH034 TaxID=3402626 RepID=UPI003BB59318
MNRQEVAALLAYAVRLDPRSAPTDQHAAADTLDQWADLLADVPATAQHPNGRHWDASQVVRHHIASSPYPIKPADVSRPWHAFKADVLGRHTDAVPAADPDDPEAYRAELLGARHAVATGAATATTYRELTGGPDPRVAQRLAALGSYMPRSVADELAYCRPRRAAREALALENRPDPLDVPCGWCRARTGQPCRSGKNGARQRATAHPSRVEDATARHNTPQEQSA